MRNFKKALLSTLLVLLCFFLMAAAVTAPYYLKGVYNYQDAQVRRDLAGEFDLLVSSASQGLRAIDPLALDEALGCRSYDLGTPLQTMYGRYLLLKLELERNPVSTVIIELSYDALARSYDDYGFEGSIYQLGRSDNPVQWLDYFFHQVPPKDWVQMLYDTLDRGVYTWKYLWKNGSYTPFQYETHGFHPGLESTPMPSPESYEADYHQNALPTDAKKDNLYYLDKCIELCQEKAIEVVLITTPLSEYKLWSFDGFDDILATHRAVSEKWGVPLYDFNLKKDKLSRYPEETAYFDQHHLCQASAKDFPKDLAEIMLRARRGEDVSEEFYTSYDEAIHARLANG